MIRRKQYRLNYPQRRGMGYGLDDLIRASGMEDCDPRDSACVDRNAQRDNAAVDQWMTVMKDPNTANLPTPTFVVNVDQSAAALNRLMNNLPLVSETSSLGTGPTVSVAALEAAQQPPSSPVAPKAAAAVTPVAQAYTTGGGSPAASPAPAASLPVFTTAALTAALPADAVSFLSSVPWWGWAAAAGVAFLALKGSK